MSIRWKAVFAALVLLAVGPFEAPAVSATELRVLSSGGLTAAFQAIIPDYEAATGNRIELVLGPSMGTSPEAIPTRLERGEHADVVLMVGSALSGLIQRGLVVADSRVDVANSKIAMAIKQGAPKPDISTAEGLRKALLAANSVAYSDSASGVYVEAEMYKKLGIEAELKPKSRKIIAERVGNVVARGEAEIGFQQVAELLPIKGITFVGEIPDEVQKVTVFSAGVPVSAEHKELARALVTFLVSPPARPRLVESGLQPIAASAR